VAVFNYVGCDDNSNGGGSGGITGPQYGILKFLMDIDGLDYNVYVDNEYLGRVDDNGESITKNNIVGNHSFYVRDNDTEYYSKPHNLHIAPGLRLTVLLGTGDNEFEWVKEKPSS
jgi:hypothetical protein